MLENRVLWFHPDKPALFYNHVVCTKKGIFGQCKATEVVPEYFDLTDPAVRQKIIDTGFIALVPKNSLPK